METLNCLPLICQKISAVLITKISSYTSFFNTSFQVNLNFMKIIMHDKKKRVKILHGRA